MVSFLKQIFVVNINLYIDILSPCSYNISYPFITAHRNFPEA